MAYGYRVGEVPLGSVPAVKEGTELRRFVVSEQNLRRPMQLSSGVHLEGAACPHPDTGDSPTLLAGVAKRFATKPPTANREKLRRLRSFVRRWVRKNISQIGPSEDLTVKTWLMNSNYSDQRKKELLALLEKRPGLRPKDFQVKMFMKTETYGDYKHGRAINSRSDRFKLEVGPIFAAIEKEVFKSPWFIKKVPVKERAKYVYDRLYAPGGKYIATDYTSFEALFVEEIMDAVEFELYDWVTGQLPCHDEFMRTVRGVLGGRNVITNKNIGLCVDATRMSGEMCTSLGNGFSNLMFMLFLCEELGSKVIGVVEGDDGLFRVVGRIPHVSDFADLGLIIKLEVHENLNEASFCGQVFDTEEMVVICDPRKVLGNFGYIDGRYFGLSRNKILGLLRAKAWSFGYQYPACPIISSLARAYLRLTASIDHRVALRLPGLSQWERDRLLESFGAGRPELNQAVGSATRALMERVYGVTTAVQIKYEEYFDSLTALEPIPNWLNLPASWADYFERYVVETRFPRLVSRPPEAWPKVHNCPLPVPFCTDEYLGLWKT